MKKLKRLKRSYTIEQLLDTILKIKEEDHGYGTHQLFDRGFDGGCPCAEGYLRIDGKKVTIWSRCWRVSKSQQDLIIGGDGDRKFRMRVGNIIKLGLDAQEWYAPYTVFLEEDYKKLLN